MTMDIMNPLGNRKKHGRHLNFGEKSMLKKSLFWIFISMVPTAFVWDETYGQISGINQVQDQLKNLSFLNRGNLEYRLGRGDLVEVSVFGIEDFTHNLRINSLGQIHLPFLGSITAAGLTPAELEKEVGSKLDGRLIRNPQVSIFVKEYRSQSVLVLGAVKSPGEYQMVHRVNLIDVLTMAGGVIPDTAGEFAVVQTSSPLAVDNKSGSEDGALLQSRRTVRVDLKKLLQAGDLSLNIPLRSGDIVQVPEREVELFYVVGEMKAPGTFRIPNRTDVYVSQAMASAGGPLNTAKMAKGLLIRYDGEGARQEIDVNFSDIIQGKQTDFLVQANDVIFVPGSRIKTLGYGLLGVIPSAVTTGIVYGTVVK